MSVKISTAQLVETVNKLLASSVCNPSTRYGMIAVLEAILRDTNEDCGFGYLSERDIPAGETPGVRFTGPELTTNFDDTDQTRRFYIHPDLNNARY